MTITLKINMKDLTTNTQGELLREQFLCLHTWKIRPNVAGLPKLRHRYLCLDVTKAPDDPDYHLWEYSGKEWFRAICVDTGVEMRSVLFDEGESILVFIYPDRACLIHTYSNKDKGWIFHDNFDSWEKEQ